MVDNDKQYRANLGSILMGLAGNFGDEFDTPTLNMWHRMFNADGYTLDQIDDAAVKIMRTRKIAKMPVYAEFVEYIEGSSEDRAHQQVDVVLEFLKYNGSRAAPKFEDPITAHLMRVRFPYQRWAKTVKEDHIQWFRKDFVKAYQAHARDPALLSTSHQIEVSNKIRLLAAGIGGRQKPKAADSRKNERAGALTSVPGGKA